MQSIYTSEKRVQKLQTKVEESRAPGDRTCRYYRAKGENGCADCEILTALFCKVEQCSFRKDAEEPGLVEEKESAA